MATWMPAVDEEMGAAGGGDSIASDEDLGGRGRRFIVLRGVVDESESAYCVRGSVSVVDIGWVTVRYWRLRGRKSIV